MFFRLLLGLTIIPIVEVIILFKLADVITWAWTLVVVLVTGVVGAWLARREGVRALKRIQSELDQGVAPTGPVIDAVLILVAGVLLVTPGVLTDVTGLLLLIPPCRRMVRRKLGEAFRKHITIVTPGVQADIIDVETVDVRTDKTVAESPPYLEQQ